jgi:hypothetical protein
MTDQHEKKPFKMVSDPHSKTTRLEPTSSSSLQKDKVSSLRPSKSPKEHFRSRQLKVLSSIQENVGALTSEKRWIIALVVSILAILVYSTFTVSLVDQFLFKRDIDLFSKESKKNEIILNVAQFALLFAFVRIVLSYL